MEKLTKELIGASSVPILLTIISKKETYGYEIIQEVKNITDGAIEYGEGTLYPVLHKLEKKGLIQSVWKKSESGRKRKYYSICEDGSKELAKEKENWKVMNNIISKLWNIETNLA